MQPIVPRRRATDCAQSLPNTSLTGREDAHHTRLRTIQNATMHWWRRDEMAPGESEWPRCSWCLCRRSHALIPQRCLVDLTDPPQLCNEQPISNWGAALHPTGSALLPTVPSMRVRAACAVAVARALCRLDASLVGANCAAAPSIWERNRNPLPGAVGRPLAGKAGPPSEQGHSSCVFLTTS